MNQINQINENAQTLETLEISKKLLRRDFYFTDDKDKRNIYRIMLSRGHLRIQFKYGDSVASTDYDDFLSDVDVIETIKADSKYIEYVGNYPAFCEDYGYEEESQQAQIIFKKCIKNAFKINAMFTTEEIENIEDIFNIEFFNSLRCYQCGKYDEQPINQLFKDVQYYASLNGFYCCDCVDELNEDDDDTDSDSDDDELYSGSDTDSDSDDDEPNYHTIDNCDLEDCEMCQKGIYANNDDDEDEPNYDSDGDIIGDENKFLCDRCSHHYFRNQLNIRHVPDMFDPDHTIEMEICGDCAIEYEQTQFLPNAGMCRVCEVAQGEEHYIGNTQIFICNECFYSHELVDVVTDNEPLNHYEEMDDDEMPELETEEWQEDWEDPDPNEGEHWENEADQEDEEDAPECFICGFHHEHIKLECNHEVCTACKPKLSNCPYCRNPI